MSTNNVNPLILLSLFKRKGGEGVYTTVINQGDSLDDNLSIRSDLGHDELPLIVYYRNDQEWVLLTDKRLIAITVNSTKVSLQLGSIKEVTLAMLEERQSGVFDKSEFSKIKLIDDKGKTYVIPIEKGEPMQGLFQVLHFLTTRKS